MRQMEEATVRSHKRSVWYGSRVTVSSQTAWQGETPKKERKLEVSASSISFVLVAQLWSYCSSESELPSTP